jgi:hypothetical protein
MSSSSPRGVAPRAEGRCSYVEGRRRCFRNGFGDPPLCRAHALAVDYEIDLEDPIGSMIEQADRFLSGNRNQIVSSFAQVLGQVLAGQRAPAPAATHEAPKAAPPPRPAPPPAPPKDDPREILGFGPDVKLTRVMVKERQRALVALMHPDKPGGSTRATQRINDASRSLLANLK